MNVSAMRLWFVRRPRRTASFSILAALVVYLLGIEWPLIIVILLVVALFLPMPKVANSFVSRIFMAVFFLYGLLQLAALVQLYTYPQGKFAYIAIVISLVTLGILTLFGSSSPIRALPVVSAKDIGAALACILFLAPFVPIMRGDNTFYGITKIAGIQVVDSAVHYGSTVTYTTVQTLRQDYTIGRYYPSGFHFATSFMEHSVLGEVRNLGWKTNALIYFFQYIVYALLLGAALVYFSFAAFESFGKTVDWLSALAIAVGVGAVVAAMFLWPFMVLGFINYYYVAAAVLVSSCYVLEASWNYDAVKGFGGNKSLYIWPAFAFLLIGFGASFSWPLLAPILLLVAFLGLVLRLKPAAVWQDMTGFGLVVLPLLVIAVPHVAAAYIQTLYWKDNNSLVYMGGALTDFNILFLLVGTGALAALVAKNFRHTADRLLVLVLPYGILIAYFMALHYFKLGEARYYVIKSAFLLDMLFLGIGAAGLAYATRERSMNPLIRLLVIPATIIFLTVATAGTVPQPFHEIRSLFREHSGIGMPPFFESDTAKIASLGYRNRLRDFNVTILHYDPAGDRYYAHIEPALWANAMAPFYQSKAQATLAPGIPRPGCFGDQLNILAYGTNQPGDKAKLLLAVRDCISSVHANGAPYYIVTDDASVPVLSQEFGNSAVIINQPVSN